MPKEYKLTKALPQPPAEIMLACEAYADLHFRGKELLEQADDYKAIAVDAVNQYGLLACVAGRLGPADSTSYPVPSMEEWDTRLSSQKTEVNLAINYAQDCPEDEKEEAWAQVAAQKMLLAQMQDYTAHLASLHEHNKYVKELKDFLIGAGVVRKIVTKTVKVYPLNPPPAKKTLPGRVDPSLN